MTILSIINLSCGNPSNEVKNDKQGLNDNNSKADTNLTNNAKNNTTIKEETTKNNTNKHEHYNPSSMIKVNHDLPYFSISGDDPNWILDTKPNDESVYVLYRKDTNKEVAIKIITDVRMADGQEEVFLFMINEQLVESGNYQSVENKQLEPITINNDKTASIQFILRTKQNTYIEDYYTLSSSDYFFSIIYFAKNDLYEKYKNEFLEKCKSIIIQD